MSLAEKDGFIRANWAGNVGLLTAIAGFGSLERSMVNADGMVRKEAVGDPCGTGVSGRFEGLRAV